MTGSLGTVIFVTSENYLRTFSGLKVSRKASYSGHKIIGRSELLEFTGIDAATCSFTVSFSAQFGLNPLKELTALRDMQTNHEAVPFVLAGEVIGRGLWFVESVDAEIETVDADGFVLSAKASLTLKEALDEGV